MTELVTVREDVQPRAMGGGNMVAVTKYESPAGGQDDPHKEYDIWAANRMYSLLLAAYPGYPWACLFDSIQGYAKISIPILTGIGNGYVINLKQTQMTPGEIVYGGGVLLERYAQSRTRFNLGAFLEARARYSGLLNPKRGIPN